MADGVLPSPIGRLGRTTFGKYRVLARLGRGGMGDVYLAVNVGPAGVSKLVVVKELREELARTPEARAMFLDEARLSTRLSHPNVVQTNEVIDDEDALYLTMEFLDGQPLHRILRGEHRERFGLAALVRIVTETLAGLHYAHELCDYDGTPLEVVHRDVSPHNIIVTYDGQAKLVDFGIAKAADATTVTESGVFKGKVRFSSPEQALCHDVDRRADVFAVGMVLWEILTREPMWKNMPDAAVLLELVAGRIPRARLVEPSVPEELDAICMKALAIDRHDRYATANEFRNALLEWLRDKGGADAELVATLASVFGTERRQLRSVIDAQIRAVRDSPTASGEHPKRPVPELGAPPAADAEQTAAEPRSGEVGTGAGAEGTRSRSRLVSVASRAAVVAVSALGISLYVASRTPGRQAPAPAVAAPPASAAPAPAPVRVQVRLTARPVEARFAIDGTPAPSNPFAADVSRDDLAHRIVASADGYEPREVVARFDRDVSIDVSLAPSAAPAAPAASGSARRTAAPPGVRVKLRPIEEEDPYGR